MITGTLGIKAGQRVWIQAGNAVNKLPEGLADHTELRVIKATLPDRKKVVLVADAEGREFVVPVSLLDPGWKLYIKDRWVPESDPAALDQLQMHLYKIIREVWPTPLERDRKSTIEKVRWVLTRNGRKLTPPPPVTNRCS